MQGALANVGHTAKCHVCPHHQRGVFILVRMLQCAPGAHVPRLLPQHTYGKL